MPDTWYTYCGSGDLDGPGIYQWFLDGVAIYTGQSRYLASRLRQYQRNMTRIKGGLPYRRGNPDGFREIHRRLFQAVRQGVAPEFRIVEQCPIHLLNDRERHHQQLMVSTAPLQELQTRLSAERRIVEAVHRSKRPNRDDVRTWMRGGATFWGDDHWFVAWGILLHANFDEEMIGDLGLRAAIEENWGINAVRKKFGSIPLRNGLGVEAVAITAFDDMWGDKLFNFFPSIDNFVNRAPSHGWLLAQRPDFSDALEQMNDEELMAIWLCETEQPYR